MLSCWSYDASKRPTFSQTKAKLFDLMSEYKRPVSPVPPPPPKPSIPGACMAELMNQSLPALNTMPLPAVAIAAPSPPRAVSIALTAPPRPSNIALPPVPEPPSPEDTSPVVRRAPERSRSFDSKRMLGNALAAVRRSLSAEQICAETPTLPPPEPQRPPQSVTLEELYAAVVSVVKAVHSLNARVTGVPACESARLVGDIGHRLKALDTTAEGVMIGMDEARRTAIRLARSVLTSDFADLFNAFKLAQGAENIPRLYRDYCVEVLQKAQVLAIDSRQLYQAAASPQAANGE